MYMPLLEPSMLYAATARQTPVARIHAARAPTAAGEPEMLMAMHVLGRPITVYHVSDRGLEPIVTYGEQLLAAPGAAAPVHLLWSGAHYDLLVPAAA